MASAGEEAARESEAARASSDPAARSRRAVALDLAGAIALVVLVQQIALRAVGLQWDFRVYLAAARAARAGLDPYVAENLARVSGHPVALPFLYPPVALLPFLALAWPSFLTAGVLWMGLKVGIAFGLAAWWGRSFAPRAGGVIAAGALAVFGANAALITDLRSGNVGLVEAGLLWWGFACWLRGRDGRFAALVVAAALFKLAPAAFLLLLLVPLPGRKARPRWFALALLALAALTLGPLAVGPWARWRGPFAGLGGPFPVGEANPGAFGLALDLARGRVAQPGLVAGAAWLAWAAALLVASRGALGRLVRAGDACGLVAAAVTLDLLLSPRPMAYGFVLGGGALAWLVAQVARTRVERAGLVALLAVQGFLAWRGEPWQGTLAGNGAFFALAALWALYLARVRGAALQSASIAPAATAHGAEAGAALR